MELLPQDAVDNWLEIEANPILEPVRKFAVQNRWSFDVRKEMGHPSDVIAQVAHDGKFDLVVMGTHGLSALAKAVLGSVATRALARLKVPVLLVP